MTPAVPAHLAMNAPLAEREAGMKLVVADGDIWSMGEGGGPDLFLFVPAGYRHWMGDRNLTPEQRAEYAALIVRAVNSHEALVKALEFYADGKRYNGANHRRIPDDPYTSDDAAYMKDVTRDGGDIARRALAAAKGSTC